MTDINVFGLVRRWTRMQALECVGSFPASLDAPWLSRGTVVGVGGRSGGCLGWYHSRPPYETMKTNITTAIIAIVIKMAALSLSALTSAPSPCPARSLCRYASFRFTAFGPRSSG
jgi:hypothetical protein